ncbi:hypothetical protein A2U01_0109965, partial [Trifolium medium]|nr:hypothetical protein [Trifolium medium]
MAGLIRVCVAIEDQFQILVFILIVMVSNVPIPMRVITSFMEGSSRDAVERETVRLGDLGATDI